MQTLQRFICLFSWRRKSIYFFSFLKTCWTSREKEKNQPVDVPRTSGISMSQRRKCWIRLSEKREITLSNQLRTCILPHAKTNWPRTEYPFSAFQQIILLPFLAFKRTLYIATLLHIFKEVIAKSKNTAKKLHNLIYCIALKILSNLIFWHSSSTLQQLSTGHTSARQRELWREAEDLHILRTCSSLQRLGFNTVCLSFDHYKFETNCLSRKRITCNGVLKLCYV